MFQIPNDDDVMQFGRNTAPEESATDEILHNNPWSDAGDAGRTATGHARQGGSGLRTGWKPCSGNPNHPGGRHPRIKWKKQAQAKREAVG